MDKFGFFVENRGKEVAGTNFWESNPQKMLFTVNAGAVRVLLPDTAQGRETAKEAKTGRFAVLSIGPAPDWNGMEVAQVTFEDGTESPYCLFSELRAFDLLPAAGDDWEMIVYAPGLREAARMPLVVRKTTKVPDFSPAEPNRKGGR